MTGNVLVRDPQSFREIHLLAMRVIQKDGTVSGVLDAFGLGRPIMQEVIADLVFGEAVRIDLENDVAAVSQPYASMLDEGDHAELRAALYKTREVRVAWLLDRSTGEIFAEREFGRYTRAPPSETGYLNPRGSPPKIPDFKRVANPVLARAALPVLEEVLGLDDVDISHVERIDKKRRLGGNNLYVPVRGFLLPGVDDQFLVPEAPGLPGTVIDSWTQLLNKGRNVSEVLVEVAPEDEVPPAPRILARRLDSLLVEVSAGLKEDPGAAAVIDRITTALRQVKAGFRMADQMERSSGRHVACVGDRAAHLEFFDELAASAKRRIIVGSAFASGNGVRTFLEHCDDAIRRGVKVTLIQGLEGELEQRKTRAEWAADPGSIERALVHDGDQFRKEVAFHLSKRPFHGKFLVIDDERVCVSSHNWLSGGAEGGPSEASIATDATQIVKTIMSHVLEFLPSDSNEAAELAGHIGRARRRETRIHFFKRTSEALREAWENLQDQRSADARAAMVAAIATARKDAAKVASLDPAILILDAEHRALLFRAMAQAKRQLLIASDGVSSAAAGARFAEALAGAVARGAEVRLRWGRHAQGEDHDGAREAAQAVKRLREYLKGKTSKAALIPEESTGNHAKVLVSDGAEALVSSFNFLSFGLAERGTEVFSREIGLLTFNPEVATTLATRLFGVGTNRRAGAGKAVQAKQRRV